MKYHCQSCGQELPDIWHWKELDPSGKQMVVTCPNCNNEFIRLEYEPNAPYGYKVIPSMIFVPQTSKSQIKKSK
jgi:DNA-directed RNA polymerase subunit RPC12/RpoP